MKVYLLIVSLFCMVFLSAQTAESIIQNHLENSGGIKNWKGLNSIILKGDAILGVEQSFPLVVYHRRPYQKKVVFLVKGKELLNEGYDGQNGWTYNEISGKNEIMKSYQPDSFDDDILDYKKKGFEATYIGKTKSDEKECYQIVLKKHTNQTTYCFSTTDYSLLWEENKDERLYYYNYKKFDGLAFATKIIGQPKNGGEYVLQFSTIYINPAIEDGVFKF
ncbi:MAG: LolA family protein [Moheibacter sp.]